jgi:hypothetical protein
MGSSHQGHVRRRRGHTSCFLLLVKGSVSLKLVSAYTASLAFNPCLSPRRPVTSSRDVSRGNDDHHLIGHGRKLSSLRSTYDLNWRLLARADSSPESELVLDNDDDDGEEGEWLPDRVKAKLKRDQSRIPVERSSSADFARDQAQESKNFSMVDEDVPGWGSCSPYTEEEEEVIAAMGGKSLRRSQRESGYLGDSTLQEIAQDYSIPISYIADVLCVWGVSPPIHIHDRLGDLVTGEQAFSLLEAVNSLDVAAVQDRYSNQNLLSLCEEWEIDLQTAFELCMKEGWSLPFGVQTCLRVEQEEELLRLHGSPHK